MDISMIEKELKLQITEDYAKELINTLKQNSNLDYQEQREEYYDNHDQQLKKDDFVVRLRYVNKKLFIALKGPRKYDKDGINSRIELEYPGSEEIREHLDKQKLKPTAITEKRRWSFNINGTKIEIDQLPYIGWFVEIEGDTIEKIKEEFNIQGKIITKNYGELLDEKLTELGLPTRPNQRALFR